MKVFVRIFSFYMLALALLPCDSCDDSISATLSDEIENISLTHTLGDDGHSEDHGGCEDEPCSPLCDCVSCFHSIDTPQMHALDISPPVAPYSTISVFYTSSLGILSLDDIWQPPRLV